MGQNGKVIHAGFLVRAARMGRPGNLSGQPPPSPSAEWEPTILAPARYRTVEKTQGGLHRHRSLMSRLGEWGWRAVWAAVLAVLLSQAAAADLVGYIQDRAAVAGRSDKALIEANPILERLRREYPDALPAILERLRAPLPSYRRGLERPVPEPKLESGILAENPDLGQLYRESPEAALDLLRLIREAAKKK